MKIFLSRGVKYERRGEFGVLMLTPDTNGPKTRTLKVFVHPLNRGGEAANGDTSYP